MGSVAVVILLDVIDKGLDEQGTVAKLLMCLIDTGVDNVSADTLAGSLLVGVSRGAGLLVGETSQSPGSVLLGGVDLSPGVLLDVLDLKDRCVNA